MIKTKIICTLGPACDDPEVLRQLIRGGMDVARMNFSHGTHEEHKQRLEKFRKACEECARDLPVLLDTKGPEIRTGEFNGKIALRQGAQFIIRHEDVMGDETQMSVSFKQLHEDIDVGQSILLDDGLVELTVTGIDPGGDITTVVANAGEISAHKSVNIPGANINLPFLTEKDIADIGFAVDNDYDFIAASFVRSAADVLQMRRELERGGGRGIKIIAKIENEQGLANIEDILRVCDGVMVARGDLGVEIPAEQVPYAQKQLIKKTLHMSKPVITATQMLDSMMRNPRPTRAEASDVANAVFDGTSCVMLSGETAAGKYPVEALATMVRIVEATEKNIHYWNRFTQAHFDMAPTVTNAISYATCTTAMNLGAAAIVAVTTGGGTARSISRFRPNCPIITSTTSRKVARQLHLCWGAYPFLAEKVGSTDELFEIASACARETGAAKDGDLVVITAGVPVGTMGTTNMLKVEMIGNILLQGRGIGGRRASGELQVVTSVSQAEEFDGRIVVAMYAGEGLLPLLRKAKALIIEEEDAEGRAQTVGLTLGIPVVVGAAGATSRLKNGTHVTVDADKGYVCNSNKE